MKVRMASEGPDRMCFKLDGLLLREPSLRDDSGERRLKPPRDVLLASENILVADNRSRSALEPLRILQEFGPALNCLLEHSHQSPRRRPLSIASTVATHPLRRRCDAMRRSHHEAAEHEHACPPRWGKRAVARAGQWAAEVTHSSSSVTGTPSALARRRTTPTVGS